MLKMVVIQLCGFLALIYCVYGGSDFETEESPKISCGEIPFDDTVTKAEYLTRSLSKRRRRGEGYRLRHDAIRVYTAANGIWLLEKGKDYPSSVYTDPWNYEYTDTIVSKWEQHLKYSWRTLNGREVNCHNKVIVRDIIEAGYPNIEYSVAFPNCQHAAKKMWTLIKDKCRAPRIETPTWMAYDRNARFPSIADIWRSPSLSPETKRCLHLLSMLQQMGVNHLAVFCCANVDQRMNINADTPYTLYEF